MRGLHFPFQDIEKSIPVELQRKKWFLVISIIVIMILPVAIGSNQTTMMQNGSASSTSGLGNGGNGAGGPFGSVQTYSTGLSGAPVVLDQPTLQSMAGGTNVSQLVTMIQKYFMPMNIRLVFLDIGWGNDANTTQSLVSGGYQQWVTNWLNASSQFQINNIFFTKQWGYFFAATSWDQDFLNAYPGTETANASGSYVPLTAGCSGCVSSSGWTDASPLVYRQYEEDLKQLYTWYGQWTNWIGFGEGATGDRNNYGGSGTAVKTSRPWDNFTMSVFANSVFFTRNINSTGYYLGTNVISGIWSMFLKDRPDIAVNSGPPLVYPEQNQVYGGAGSGGVIVAERFYVPFGTNLNGFTLKAYVSEVGSPASLLYETIYPDNFSSTNGRPIFHTVENESVSGVGTTAGWIPTSFTSTLVGGDYYWVIFTSPSSGTSSSSYYLINLDQQPVFLDIYPLVSTNGLSGLTRGNNNNAGGSVLWIQNKAGQNIAVYPYLNQGPNQPDGTTYFEVNKQVNVNMLSFLESDRAYDPNNLTMSLEYPNGTVLTTGVFSVKNAQGVSTISYLPIQLASKVTLYPNIKYQIVVSNPPPSDTYDGSSGGGVSQDFITETANPASAGYLGQATWAPIQVGLMNIEPNGISNYNYLGTTDLQWSPGEQPGSEVALRFAPTSSGTLQEFEVEVVSVSSTTGVLNVTLRSDNTTVGSHPSNMRSSLAYGTITLSTLSSTLHACTSAYNGQCTWGNVTFTGSTSLTAGTNYWLVMNATQNQRVGLERLVGPYKNLVYTSTNDYQQNWNPPSDGPTDLSYQVITSTGDYNNTVLGDIKLGLGTVGQSFQSSSSFQLKGIWVPTSFGAPGIINVTVRTDSGGDSPSSTALAWGLIQSNTPGSSMNYASLNLPVNITLGTKYWFTESFTCEIAQCSSNPNTIALVYRSDAKSQDYGGTALHYETFSGGVWSSPSQEGDIIFILAGSTSTINTYNTKTLYNEVLTYDDQSTANIPIQGWNAFLDYEQASINYNLTQMMSQYSSRTFQWFTALPSNIESAISNINQSYVLYGDSGAGGPIGCPPSYASCGGSSTFWLNDASQHFDDMMSFANQNNWLPWSSFGNTQDNRGDLTPAEMRTEYLTGIPFNARNPVTFNDWLWGASYHGLNNITEQQYSTAFGNILARMAYNGGYYGTEKDALRVLWLSSSNDGFFPQFISGFANITLTTDTNLTVYGSLSQFNVIVEDGSPSSNAMQRITAFVKAGGGVVEIAFGQSANSQDNFLGLTTNSVSASTTSTLTILQSNAITSPYTSLSYSPYWLRYQIAKLGNESAQYLVQDSNGNPVITANNYFSGRGVLIEQPYARLESSGNAFQFDGCCQYGSPRDSWVSLFVNALFYAAHKDSTLPIVWESSYNQQQNWSPYLQFSIDGSPGKPVLLWLSSNDSGASPFDIHLNATFYNISTQGWIAINMLDMSVVGKGTGSDIHISTAVPAYSWAPIYIMNDTSQQNLAPLYSTASIISSSSSGSSVTYTISGPSSASTWMVFSSPQAPASVSSSKIGTIQQYSTLQSLNSSKIGYSCTSIGSGGTCNSWNYYDQEGWYYDQSHQLLYVHFQDANPLTISVSGVAGQTSTTSTTTLTSTSSISPTTSTTLSTISTNSSSQSANTSTSSVQTTSTAASVSSTGSTSSATTSASSQPGSGTPRSSSAFLSFLGSSPLSSSLTAYEITLIAGLPLMIRISKGGGSKSSSSDHSWRW